MQYPDSFWDKPAMILILVVEMPWILLQLTSWLYQNSGSNSNRAPNKKQEKKQGTQGLHYIYKSFLLCFLLSVSLRQHMQVFHLHMFTMHWSIAQDQVIWVQLDPTFYINFASQLEMIHWEEISNFSKDLITSEALTLLISLEGQFQNLSR